MSAAVESGLSERTDAGAGWSEIRSPVSWALLALVIEQSGYGYALLKRFEREYARVLPIKSDWHIYRALDGLVRRGLIEQVPVGEASRGRQPKPHYRATGAGLRSYCRWLAREVGATRRQGQLFARQLAALARVPEVALQIIDSYELLCLDGATAGALPPAAAGDRLATRLVAEEQRLGLSAILPWLEYARREFGALARAANGAGIPSPDVRPAPSAGAASRQRRPLQSP